MTDTQNLKVGSSDPIEVLAPDPVWATVTNLGPDAAYYDDSPLVSALSKDGTLSVGSSLTFVASKHFLSAGRSRLSVEIPDRLSWLESQIDVFDASASTGLPLPAAASENAPLNVKAYGATGDGTTDDTLAVQATLDACRDAGGGLVDFPAGTYKITATLTRHPSVSLRGETGASRLEWATDLGAGESAMVCDGDVSTEQQTRRIEGLWFRGPTVPVVDGTNASMQGPLTQPFDTWVNCRSDRFFSGFSVIEHHETFISCLANGNRYGVYFSGLGSANTFDQTFISTVLTGNSLASVGIASGELIGTSSFVKTHFGFSPYCVHKEATATDEYLTELTTFEACTFEAYGNGIFYDESLRNAITNTMFLNCTDSVPFSATYKAASRAADWVINVGDVLNCEFRHGAYGFLVWPGALGIVKCRTMFETQWSDMSIAISRCISGSKELAHVTNTVLESGGRARDRLVQFRPANAALAVGELVFREATTYASKASGVIPLGVVATAASGFGDLVAVYTTGSDTTVKSSGVIAAGAAVKPSGSFDGAVVASTGWSDGPIVGVATAAASGGTVTCDLATL